MSTNSPAPTQPSSRSSLRVVLFALLGVMLFALWYDQKVARPAVEDALKRIGQLNDDFNKKGGKLYLTNVEVQNELKRAPIETYSEGGYFVEVYGWRAGLPIKSHKYFAVYTEETPYTFLRHYAHNIPEGELTMVPNPVPSTAGGQPGGVASFNVDSEQPANSESKNAETDAKTEDKTAAEKKESDDSKVADDKKADDKKADDKKADDKKADDKEPSEKKESAEKKEPDDKQESDNKENAASSEKATDK